MTLCGLFSGANAGAESVLIPTNAVWRYLDNGSDQESFWVYDDFDDSGWAQGAAELGYGDDTDGRPEATVVSYGPDPDNKYITTYFRQSFVVSNAGSITNLRLRLLRDDGALVYLNGAEVFRSNMPDAPVNYLTLAQSSVSSAEETTFLQANISPELVYNGLNILAVEIHQSSQQSTDISFALELVAERVPTPPVALIRGPYLQMGTPRSIVVRWRTDFPTDSVVAYGTAPDNLNQAASALDETTEHAIQLSLLSPNTRYYYSVGNSSGMLAGGPDYCFLTAPIAPKPTRIWAIGDCGTAGLGGNAAGVRDAYRNYAGGRYTDVWLFLGDNAYYEGTDRDYQRAVFETYPEMLRKTVAWSTLGNHETYAPTSGPQVPYFDIFSMPTQGEAGGVPSGTEHYYSFNYGSIHFVCLDSELSNRQPNGPMLTWLQADLAANTNKWLIAFWHSPPYTKGSHDSDNLFDNGGNMTEMRTGVVPVLESYGVDLVLSGHSHNYERSYLLSGHYGFADSITPSMVKDSGSGRPAETGAYLKPTAGPGANEGAVYVVAGSSGWATHRTGFHPAMYVSLLEMGSLVLDVDGNRLDAKFLRENGVIKDEFTILKGGPAEPLRIATFRLSNGKALAQWKSVAGHTYQIERSASLTAPQWVAASNPIQASGATTSWTNAVGGGSGFYRVVTLVD